MPAVFLLPFLSLFFASRHVPGILETGRAVETVVACRAAERLHRMRRSGSSDTDPDSDAF